MRRCTKWLALLAVWILLMYSLNLDIRSFVNDNWNGKGPRAALCWWDGTTDTVGKGLQYQTILIFLFFLC